MTTNIVPLRLPDGTEISAEVSEGGGYTPSAISRDPDERIDFAAALKRVEMAAGLLVESLKKVQPQECELTFGIKLGGKAGVIFAEGTAEANFTVKMKWTQGK